MSALPSPSSYLKSARKDVNGTSVGGGQERKLMNGDVIRLADEEFKFQQN